MYFGDKGFETTRAVDVQAIPALAKTVQLLKCFAVPSKRQLIRMDRF